MARLDHHAWAVQPAETRCESPCIDGTERALPKTLADASGVEAQSECFKGLLKGVWPADRLGMTLL